MVQRLTSKPEDLDLLMGMPATIGELEGEELEIPTERETGIPPREKILEIAKRGSSQDIRAYTYLAATIDLEVDPEFSFFSEQLKI